MFCVPRKLLMCTRALFGIILQWCNVRCGSLVESRRDDPTPPRYAMSGFHIEMDEAMYPAATDARHRTYPRRHDMAAGW